MTWKTRTDREPVYEHVAAKLEGMGVEDAWAIAYGVVDSLIDDDVMMPVAEVKLALVRIQDKVGELRGKVDEVRDLQGRRVRLEDRRDD